jgi:hypothetical protein
MKLWDDVSETKIFNTDLNELVRYDNNIFADAAARDAFLTGDLAPVPGMTAYMADDGVTYRRITVGAASYWAPAPGTHLVCMTAGGNMGSMGGNVAYQLTTLTTVRTRNLGGLWANSRFTPVVPGFYELEASVCLNHSATDGYRAAWLSLNGASVATAINGSWNQFYPTGGTLGSQINVPTRSVCTYFNGTDGSYATVMVMHNSATAHNTMYYNTDHSYVAYGSWFSAKYLGL